MMPKQIFIDYEIGDLVCLVSDVDKKLRHVISLEVTQGNRVLYWVQEADYKPMPYCGFQLTPYEKRFEGVPT